MWKLAWVDVETCGLDPKLDPVLEVGIVLTDENLEITASIAELVKVPAQYVASRLGLNEKVKKMHTDNGLLVEAQVRGTAREVLDKKLALWLEENNGWNRPMAGSNPSFDRGMLQSQFPLLARKFHYRSFDMNTLYAFFDVPKDRDRVETHRALDDIMRDLNTCRELKKKYLGG